MDILKELYSVITDRKANPTEGSYTNYLLEAGTEKIAKKLGEEAVETAIAAAKNPAEVAEALTQAKAAVDAALATINADRAAAAEAKLACVTAGVQKDSIDDVLAIAAAKVTDDKNLDAVLEEMKKEHDKFCKKQDKTIEKLKVLKGMLDDTENN